MKKKLLAKCENIFFILDMLDFKNIKVRLLKIRTASLSDMNKRTKLYKLNKSETKALFAESESFEKYCIEVRKDHRNKTDFPYLLFEGCGVFELSELQDTTIINNKLLKQYIKFLKIYHKNE